MMEQPILGLRPEFRSPAWPDEEWRAFSWHELVVRLAVARDMRRVLLGEAGVASGSFAPVHAPFLAAHARDAGEQDEQAVNPVDLGNGKANGRTFEGVVEERSPAS